MYDIIVIGAGHAGIEAAMAACRMQKKVALVTLDIQMAGSMPCNPSVGGPAKGIVVREIDALGGLMPIVADQTALQFKMLNTTKGPGVWSLRVQSDKEEYKKQMASILQNTKGLTVIEDACMNLLIENQRVTGVHLKTHGNVLAQAVILTTGTYMTSTILRGHTATVSGPEDQPTIQSLSAGLQEHGVRLFRLKTGTPPRILRDSIDFSKAEKQPGTPDFFSFSETTKPEDVLSFDRQEICHLIYTTPKTHEIIREHLQDSAMYSGLVKGVGPRYCPSIEDKLVRFADKERHQLFLEPESKSLETIYLQGFSTSMPIDVQEQMVHSLPGLENAKIVKYAYAIEYDAIDPLQMKPSMENKVIENLFTAGQVNGTSGYEEAAGQGLMAGINAALKIDGKEPFVLRRDEAYIGVMIDDLCTKGTKEPYRLLTSRAEYRLLLRHDNADQRLLEKGYQLGVVSKERYEQFQKKMETIQKTKELLQEVHIKPTESINAYLSSLGFDPLQHGCSALELLKRPQVTIKGLQSWIEQNIDASVARQIEIEVKYAGYIEKAKRDARHLQAMDQKKLPEGLDYLHMDNLRLEARQKLDQIRPSTLGQASRISGINPSDIAILSLCVKPHKK
ncbi:tRNA uridine-5-carboxymethylaminomethyl(34) synthesis enzyme MnmG [Faecalicoccus pleomorphus]|uniref:tRNA uridine-5-carboxymethylaminomethyl(34) synthesis enzyme MnmG n=1 Tax=Faecalicoccus pleomorphus TaxID=1323 RepID=UPI00233019F5|nr:tRNA uridine-5-carboxymethylaminomethyl(34) synthesis enzyme MnmG [Faecalicoccus pleomorphus]MDB7986391.1 tRNA uridine-5-carboxymethylaminomethyl(34) synthesis enzyme MnmG [Faecalicoccus pleomorphus]MDB7990161.1 tRNA uridine-5-carboxymethylaminomethyl(34) synthesis enzyme MnmG [Faecalicoccus pleomorphus]